MIKNVKMRKFAKLNKVTKRCGMFSKIFTLMS